MATAFLYAVRQLCERWLNNSASVNSMLEMAVGVDDSLWWAPR